MKGKFTYRRGNEKGIWEVTYEGGPFPALQARIRKEGKGWVLVPGYTEKVYPTRLRAAVAYLEYVLLPKIELREKATASIWREVPRVGLTMTEREAEEVYDILIEKAGAHRDDKGGFVHRYAGANATGSEWRFCGNLGFGGKFYPSAGRWNVSAYPEDLDIEKRWIICETNERLQEAFLAKARARGLDAIRDGFHFSVG